MKVKYHEALGDPANKQDPLPENWQEISARTEGEPCNFGIVEEGKLYRSGIVWQSNVEWLYKTHNIRNIITLVDGDWLTRYYDDPRITIHQFPFFQRRALTKDRVRDIVDVINSLQEPCVVSCLKGVVRTGMVVAGYEIMNGRKSNLAAMLESMAYGNVNLKTLKEILQYSRNGHHPGAFDHK